MTSLKDLLDAGLIPHQLGPWTLAGLATMVFIESGVLFPFLPGDSLLVTAAALHLELGVTLAPAGAVVRPSGWLGGSNVTGFGPLAGAGGLFGTAADLLTFGESRLDAPPPPLLIPQGLPRHLRGVTPGWMVSGPEGEVRWHDGLARGTRAGLGFNTRSGAVVALLSRGTDSPLGVRGAMPGLLLSLLGAGER